MSDLAGTWNVDVVTPMMSDTGKLVLSVDAEGQITGRMENSRGEALPIGEGALDGSGFKFVAQMSKPVKLKMTWTGSFADGGIAGVVKLGPIGKGTFKGVREA